MLQAFFDDSGNEPQSPVFMLCGFVSSKARWAEFTREWNETLAGSPRPLDYFKMVEANRLTGQFAGWTPEERDSKLAQLTTIIQRNVMFAVRAGVLWKVYQDVQSQFPEYKYGPYDHLFHIVMGLVVKHVMALPVYETVEFIFDEQGKAGKRVRESFEVMKSFLPPEQLAYVENEPQHQSDREFIPLQAADMYAWQNRRFISDNTKYCSPTIALLDQIPVEEFAINELNLTLFFEELRIQFPSNRA